MIEDVLSLNKAAETTDYSIGTQIMRTINKLIEIKGQRHKNLLAFVFACVFFYA